MSKVDFAAQRKAAEREGLITNSDYFKIQEGANRIRLMSECLPHPGEYQGRPTFKWLTYVLDRTDGRVKPFFMPHTIYKQMEALQRSEDYAFDSVPMPYDLTINAKGAGTRDVEYSVVPARKNTPLTQAEEAQLAEKKPLSELQTTLRQKTTERGDERGGEPHFNPDEVPF